MSDSIHVVMTSLQDGAFAMLNDYYGDCRAKMPDNPLEPGVTGCIKLEAIDDDGDVRARWLVHDSGEVRAAWDPDNLLEEWNKTLDGLAFPTDAQMTALQRLMRQRSDNGVHVYPRPSDQPADYLGVVFQPDRFECGIAPDGSVNS